MYLPEHFAENDAETMHELIRRNPLALLVLATSDGPVANHIPFVLDVHSGDQGTLIGHVARNNSVWQAEPIGDALVVFQSADAYISPNFYPTKAETHEVVPTWNYAVVQAHGPLQVHDEPRWVRGAVGRLTKQMEASETPSWMMADAPSDYVAGMLENIVGIEIPISRLLGKWKVSQNRNEADRAGAATGLDARGTASATAMADLIRER